MKRSRHRLCSYAIGTIMIECRRRGNDAAKMPYQRHGEDARLRRSPEMQHLSRRWRRAPRHCQQHIRAAHRASARRNIVRYVTHQTAQHCAKYVIRERRATNSKTVLPERYVSYDNRHDLPFESGASAHTPKTPRTRDGWQTQRNPR